MINYSPMLQKQTITILGYFIKFAPLLIEIQLILSYDMTSHKISNNKNTVNKCDLKSTGRMQVSMQFPLFVTALQASQC